jgi:esterase/lipase
LGQHVTLAGISMGGVAAAWAAQNCKIDRAVLIAPAFAMPRVSERLNTLLSRVLILLPNFFLWWDRAMKTNTVPMYAYPRFSTHAAAHIYMLGAEVYQCAHRSKPLAHAILSVTSIKDMAVNNRVTLHLVEHWRNHGASVQTFEFAGENIPPLHDILSPEQIGARTDVIYPVLVDLINQ